jgi:hypothetical protein
MTPWTLIEDAETARRFASALATQPVRTIRGTSISGALAFAAGLFEGNGYEGIRQVIDVSGDGPNSAGAPVVPTRDAVDPRTPSRSSRRWLCVAGSGVPRPRRIVPARSGTCPLRVRRRAVRRWARSQTGARRASRCPRRWRPARRCGCRRQGRSPRSASSSAPSGPCRRARQRPRQRAVRSTPRSIPYTTWAPSATSGVCMP